MRLIVNCDDFGYSKAVNYGIIEAYKNGIATSATLMAGMPGFNHALELIRENPGLGCGVHLTLSAYKPILKTHKTIVNEKPKRPLSGHTILASHHRLIKP